MQTEYTMSKIRDFVYDLKEKAINQHKANCDAEFNKLVEDNPGIELDFKAFAEAVTKINQLADKYREGRYFARNYTEGYLRSFVQDSYRNSDSKIAESEKIYDQFRVIENRLKSIRNPSKAIEFLKLCGIEIPERSIPIKPDPPIDVEFIKSVLPKNLLLTEGPQI